MGKSILLTLSKHTLHGGVETFTRYLQEAVPGLTVISQEDVHSSPRHSFLFPFLPEPKTAWELDQRANTLSNVEVVFANGMHGWALTTCARKIPTLSILHGTYAGLAEAGYPKTSPLFWRMRHIYSFFEKKSAQNAHVCIANSPFTAREAQKYYGVSPRVIELPVDTTLFSPGSKQAARKTLKWSPHSTHIVFVGNPTPSKGFDTLLALIRAHPAMTFHLIGNNMPTLPVKNAVTHDTIPHAELVTYYRAADATVFPSRYEGFGFVPLEALASGCPVLARCVGILHEFQPEGLLLAEDEEGFIAQLPPASQGKVPKKTIEAIKIRFSVNKFVQGYQSLLRETIQRVQKEKRV